MIGISTENLHTFLLTEKVYVNVYACETWLMLPEELDCEEKIAKLRIL